MIGGGLRRERVEAAAAAAERWQTPPPPPPGGRGGLGGWRSGSRCGRGTGAGGPAASGTPCLAAGAWGEGECGGVREVVSFG